MRVEIVPATAELLTRFYGEAPKRSMRALVGVCGDEVLGVVALVPDGNRLALISEMKPEARKYRKAIVRAAREIMRIAQAAGAPVHASPDPEIACAKSFLERIGFSHLHGDVYECKPSR